MPTLAAAGEPVYKAHCAECHEPGGRRTGTVIPLDEIGTDRHRLDMWTADAAHGLQRVRRGIQLEVRELPQDERLHVGAARRDLADRAVSAQRIGADAGRSARAGGAASDAGSGAATICSTPCASASSARARRRGERARCWTCRVLATATPVTPTARRCQPKKSARCSST